MRTTLRCIVTSILILALAGAACGTELPSAPKAVEHDPGAWGATTVFTTTVTGAFTRPWIGFAAGVVVAVAPNLQDSRAAHQNMVGGIVGAAAGYVLIKTLKRDWKHK